jgi:fatty-acyl-CoA synthase
MAVKAKLEREWRFMRGLNRTLARVKSIDADSDNLVCDDMQEAVEE